MTNDQILNAFILKLQAQLGQLTVNNALLQSHLEAAQERIRELETQGPLGRREDGEPAEVDGVTSPNVRS